MRRAMRVRNARWPLRAWSLLTLVALLVAPSCAPLCASRNCPSADASATANGNCHGAGAMSHKALRAHAFRSCGSPEMPAVVSTSTGFGGAYSVIRSSAPANYFDLEPQNAAPTVPFSDSHLGRSPDFLSSFASVPPSVLRI